MLNALAFAGFALLPGAPGRAVGGGPVAAMPVYYLAETVATRGRGVATPGREELSAALAHPGRRGRYLAVDRLSWGVGRALAPGLLTLLFVHGPALAVPARRVAGRPARAAPPGAPDGRVFRHSVGKRNARERLACRQGELQQRELTMVELVVGSRASQLARTQVREFLAPVRERFPDLVIRHRAILEDGDLDRRAALREVSERGGGSAFSTNQVAALLNREVDVVVHSLKDLPTENPDGLILLPPPPRADVRDALCGAPLAALPPGARIGTSAARRIAQLLHVRPDLRPERIRGNVPTRLARLKSLDAVVLAAAGLRRLGRAADIAELLPLELFPPSPGQGALGIQLRADNTLARELLDHTGDLTTDAEVRAERAMLAELHGGCSVPVGAHATTADGVLTLHGQVTSVDGVRQVEARLSGTPDEPEKLGVAVAGALLDRHADSILAEARAYA